MKYYEICMGDGDPRCCHPYISPNSPWLYECLAQNELNEIHELPIPLEVDNKYEPYDHLVSNIEIVSKKAFNLIKSLNNRVQGFESQMYYKGEKIWDIFYTIIVPKYNLLNYKKSVYKKRTSSITGITYITDIEKLVLDSENLKLIKGDNFFAIEEQPVGIYCTEKAKHAIEEAGLIGFGFEEIPVE